MKRIVIFTLSLLVAVGLSTRIWYVNTHVDPQFTPPKTEIYQWENGLNWTVIFSFLPMKVQKAML